MIRREMLERMTARELLEWQIFLSQIPEEEIEGHNLLDFDQFEGFEKRFRTLK